jgi:uncharacterized protein (DUF433 family)
MEWKNHIEINHIKMNGKPVIKGTRIPVDMILEKLADNYSYSDLLEAYPHITKDDITACLLFASNSVKNEIYLEYAS